MSKIIQGIIAGIAFGCIEVLLMLPMSFPDKKVANRRLLQPFCHRIYHWLRGIALAGLADRHRLRLSNQLA
jgi:hypothetical protein